MKLTADSSIRQKENCQGLARLIMDKRKTQLANIWNEWQNVTTNHIDINRTEENTTISVPQNLASWMVQLILF